MSTALSVNLNKIAVLRNSRGGGEPDVLRAGIACLEAGAHGLTVHPRPDARHIRTDDIPEEYRDIVDAIGMEAFVHLTLLCGGQTLYVPKRESLERGARDRDIRALFNGSNYRSLAAQFRLSERQIRKIINGSRC